MKKLISFFLVLLCIGFLIGCGKTSSVEKLTEAIRSEGIQVTRTGVDQVIALSSEDTETIASFLERSEWIDDIPKCPYDYMLTVGGYTFYYHSHGCFVFDGRWLSIDDISKKGFNLMFEPYEVGPPDSNSNPTLPEQTSESDTQNDVAVSTIEIREFSYEDELKKYKENDPGVYYDGFSNTSLLELTSIEEAIERAKNECTIKYDAVDVSYDSVAYIWKITFSTGRTPGGCQTVYMDRCGVTSLVVYGE